MAIIGLTLLSFLYPFWPQIKRTVRRSPRAQVVHRDPVSRSARLRDLVTLAVFGGVALVGLNQSADLNREAAVFPETIAMAMLVLVAVAILRLFLTRQVTEVAVDGSWLRMAALPLAMMAATFLFQTFGFAVTAVMLGLVLTLVAQHDRYSAKGWTVLLASVVGITLGCIVLFGKVLSVPLP